jgi:hypothetical protein
MNEPHCPRVTNYKELKAYVNHAIDFTKEKLLDERNGAASFSYEYALRVFVKHIAHDRDCRACCPTYLIELAKKLDEIPIFDGARK